MAEQPRLQKWIRPQDVEGKEAPATVEGEEALATEKEGPAKRTLYQQYNTSKNRYHLVHQRRIRRVGVTSSAVGTPGPQHQLTQPYSAALEASWLVKFGGRIPKVMGDTKITELGFIEEELGTRPTSHSRVTVRVRQRVKWPLKEVDRALDEANRFLNGEQLRISEKTIWYAKKLANNSSREPQASRCSRLARRTGQKPLHLGAGLGVGPEVRDTAQGETLAAEREEAPAAKKTTVVEMDGIHQTYQSDELLFRCSTIDELTLPLTSTAPGIKSRSLDQFSRGVQARRSNEDHQEFHQRSSPDANRDDQEQAHRGDGQEDGHEDGQEDNQNTTVDVGDAPTSYRSLYRLGPHVSFMEFGPSSYSFSRDNTCFSSALYICFRPVPPPPSSPGFIANKHGRIVEYATREQAQQAVNTLSNQNLMGQLVYVREV
ncbi:uncharacterized protein BDZ99DRAFT_545491 [Mytilinidion resinicola]|uniref:RRM domain-containing protein n=1 Tax=Mytilinidion resinicola TaxID=574789 RepID=A0A6A6Y6D7_9PEZI|nr:uncharacterized protein BDZ99DRAFT_545491 [Mytilinidion resinicola]KAF2804250.1 hypothetical protein BDZ99DRAFT_545491 [Mytilinidion resinicola]